MNMKTLLAIELLKSQAQKKRIEEMETIKQIIMLQNEWISEDIFTIGWMEETDMRIDIDELFIDVDGMALVDWLKMHCETDLESDKSITIIKLR